MFSKKQGTSMDKKEISWPDLVKIITQAEVTTDETSSTESPAGRPPAFSHLKYIQKIENAVIELGLSENIIVEEGGKFSVPEGDRELHFKSNVIIRNLVVEVDDGTYDPDQFDRDQLKFCQFAVVNEGDISLSEIPTDGVHVIFEDNKFKSFRSGGNRLKIICEEQTRVTFRRNTFKRVGVHIGGDPSIDYIFTFDENTVKDGYIMLEGEYYFSHENESVWPIDFILPDDAIVNGYTINKKIYNRISIAKSLTKKLKIDPAIKVDPEIIDYPSSKSIIRLTDNDINKIAIEVRSNVYLYGKNTINKIEPKNDANYIYFGPYQEIDAKGQFAHENKEFFIDLLEKATQRNDHMQMRVIQTEIKKCDRHLINKEPWSKSFNDKIALNASYIISRFGGSWLRPLGLFFVINFLFTLAVCLHADIDCETFVRVYFEFFNPLSSPADTIGKDTWPLSAINAFQKALYAWLAFEIIRALRRFAVK